MVDPRNKKLAEILVDYSVKVKREDKVLIECSDPEGLPLAKEIYKLILLKNAYPYLLLGTEDLSYFYFKNATKKQLTKKPKIMDFIADWVDKSIRIKAAKNDRQLANVKPESILLHQKTIEKVQDKFLKKPWVVTYWPTESMAQSAEMSLDELEDFYFRSCLQDWQKIGERLTKIKKFMDNALKIEVLGEKTKLNFSLKGRFAMVCDGKYNMPDGEIFSAPLDNTMTGEIYFDFPTLRLGKEVRDIWLRFKNGKVVASSASYNKDFLKKSLKLDKGSSRPGEFALGANFGITRFMQNTLFDEKIGGTIHLALGRAYEGKEGGGINKSAIHWDLVKDMRKKGSSVAFDGKVVLKDGKLI